MRMFHTDGTECLGPCNWQERAHIGYIEKTGDTVAKETIRDAKPMDPKKVRAIKNKQYESNGIPPEVCPRITAGKICPK